MLNTEQICKGAIAVVERYLDDGFVYWVGYMHDELQEAQEAVDDAWDESISRKSTRLCRLCRAAWHACLAAKNDERVIAKVYADEYWDQA
tara:strand:+ start:116 stop:385 length:270 start_codon:yes stop_codon:yes gene_type:complete